MVPADSDGASPTPPYSGYTPPNKTCLYGAITLYRTPSQALRVRFAEIMHVLQPLMDRDPSGLGPSHFARHYSGNHCCFLFLRLLRCFSSPGLPLSPGPWSPTRGVAPFGHLRIVSLCADPRSFSQLTTSFIASESLGIPRMLLMTFLLPLFRGGNPNSYSLYFQYVKELTPGNPGECGTRTVPCVFCVENNGFEPLTPCVQGRCSSQLS